MFELTVWQPISKTYLIFSFSISCICATIAGTQLPDNTNLELSLFDLIFLAQPAAAMDYIYANFCIGSWSHFPFTVQTLRHEQTDKVRDTTDYPIQCLGYHQCAIMAWLELLKVCHCTQMQLQAHITHRPVIQTNRQAGMKKNTPVMTTSRSGMSAAGAEMTKDVDWLAFVSPRPSPRTVTLNGSITVNTNGLPVSHTHSSHIH